MVFEEPVGSKLIKHQGHDTHPKTIYHVFYAELNPIFIIVSSTHAMFTYTLRASYVVMLIVHR